MSAFALTETDLPSLEAPSPSSHSRPSSVASQRHSPLTKFGQGKSSMLASGPPTPNTDDPNMYDFTRSYPYQRPASTEGLPRARLSGTQSPGVRSQAILGSSGIRPHTSHGFHGIQDDEDEQSSRHANSSSEWIPRFPADQAPKGIVLPQAKHSGVNRKYDVPKSGSPVLRRKHFDVKVVGNDALYFEEQDSSNSFTAAQSAGSRAVHASTRESASSPSYLRYYYTDYLSRKPAQPIPVQNPEENNGKQTMYAEDMLQWLASDECQPRTRLDAYPVLVVARDAIKSIADGTVRLASKQLEDGIRETQRLQAEVERQNREYKQKELEWSSRISKAEAEAQSLRNANAEMQHQLDEQNKKLAEMESKLSSMSKLRRRIITLTASNAALHMAASNAGKTIASLRSELSVRDDSIKQLQADLSVARQALLDAIDEQAQNSNQSSDAEDSLRRIAELEAELQKAQDDADRARQQVESFQRTAAHDNGSNSPKAVSPAIVTVSSQTDPMQGNGLAISPGKVPRSPSIALPRSPSVVQALAAAATPALLTHDLLWKGCLDNTVSSLCKDASLRSVALKAVLSSCSPEEVLSAMPFSVSDLLAAMSDTELAAALASVGAHRSSTSASVDNDEESAKHDSDVMEDGPVHQKPDGSLESLVLAVEARFNSLGGNETSATVVADDTETHLTALLQSYGAAWLQSRKTFVAPDSNAVAKQTDTASVSRDGWASPRTIERLRAELAEASRRAAELEQEAQAAEARRSASTIQLVESGVQTDPINDAISSGSPASESEKVKIDTRDEQQSKPPAGQDNGPAIESSGNDSTPASEDIEEQDDSSEQVQLEMPKSFKFYKAKTLPPPMRLSAIHSLIATIYNEKITADEADDREGNTRATLPDFVFDFFMFRYGLKSLAIKNLRALLAGVQKFAKTSSRVRGFARLCGMLDTSSWSDGATHFVLAGLDTLYPRPQIKERMDQKNQPMIRQEVMERATVASLKSKWGCALALEMEDAEKIRSLGQGQGGADDETLVGVDDWVDAMVTLWTEQQTKLQAKLARVFAAYDDNGDGVLSFAEFSKLVSSVQPDATSRFITRLYRGAVSACSGDAIDKQVFAKMALQHGVLPARDTDI